MQKIKFYKKSVYGSDRFYLKDKKDAENWKRLSGDKTLTEYKIKALKGLIEGVKFVQVVENQKEF